MKNIILTALFMLCCILLMITCEKQKKENKAEGDIISAINDTIKHYTDDAARIHAVRQVAEAGVTGLRMAYAKTIDSLKNLLKLKDEQFKSIILAGSKNAGSVTLRVDTVYVDTMYTAYKISYTDKWLSLSGKIGEENFLDYEMRDSLAFTVYQKKTGFLGLGKPATYIDAFSLNPKSVISGITAMQVPVKQPGRISIGPYLGFGYNGMQWQPSAGISIQYSLIRF